MRGVVAAVKSAPAHDAVSLCERMPETCGVLGVLMYVIASTLCDYCLSQFKQPPPHLRARDPTRLTSIHLHAGRWTGGLRIQFIYVYKLHAPYAHAQSHCYCDKIQASSGDRRPSWCTAAESLMQSLCVVQGATKRNVPRQRLKRYTECSSTKNSSTKNSSKFSILLCCRPRQARGPAPLSPRLAGRDPCFEYALYQGIKKKMFNGMFKRTINHEAVCVHLLLAVAIAACNAVTGWDTLMKKLYMHCPQLPCSCPNSVLFDLSAPARSGTMCTSSAPAPARLASIPATAGSSEWHAVTAGLTGGNVMMLWVQFCNGTCTIYHKEV